MCACALDAIFNGQYCVILVEFKYHIRQNIQVGKTFAVGIENDRPQENVCSNSFF